MQIDVSLEVYKALTERLRYEGHRYDDVLRDLLDLDSPVELDRSGPDRFESVSAAMMRGLEGNIAFHSRGLRLPNGTKLRTRYKQREYLGEIVDGEWLDENGHRQSSPSAAATAITGNNVNGLRFWEALVPGDTSWRRLDSLGQT